MNTGTPLEPNDPRLSAYVLGELPAEEALVISAMLRHSPEAQKEVEQLQEMADLLRESFSLELEAAPVADQPTLALLPFEGAEDSKVVPFRKEATPVEKQLRQMKVVAIGSLAAAITMGLFLVPGLKPGPGANQIGPGGEVAEASAPSHNPIPVPTGGANGPWVNYAEEGPSSRATGYEMSGLVQPVSLTEASREVMTRPLGQDPVITEVRMLAADPVELTKVPLPASGLGYLDRSEYQEPEFVQRPVLLGGGIFREGESVRSAVLVKRNVDPDGSLSVVVEGVAQSEHEYPVAESGFDLEVSPLVFSQEPAAPAASSYGPSYLTPLQPEAADSIENRYLVKLLDRVHEAFQCAQNAEAQLTGGNLAAAASELELALQVLPDVEATAPTRSRLEDKLEEINATLRQR